MRGIFTTQNSSQSSLTVSNYRQDSALKQTAKETFILETRSFYER